MTTIAEVRRLLGPTSLPADLIDDLLAEASVVWLMGEKAAILARELVLCHPPLGLGEVRAVAQPTTVPGAWRLSVVAHDRPGLLAGLAGALASQRLSILDASATLLAGQQLAMQRVTAVHADGVSMDEAEWDAVGRRLQAELGQGRPPHFPWFEPRQPVTVAAQTQDLGRALVTVEAPDQVGLLWMAATWFEARGCNIEAYRATSSAGTARDTFVVVGDCDWTGLAGALGGAPAAPWGLPEPLKTGVRVGVTAAALGAATVVQVLRWMRRQPPSPER